MNVTARFLAHASLVLTPVLYVQGFFTRHKIAKLPVAAGESSGRLGESAQSQRILFLGESTAAGVGADTHHDGLAGQTAAALHAMTDASIHWRVYAQNGLTARGLRGLVATLPEDTRADIIVIALGANDVFRLQGPVAWSRDLRELIDAIRERCGFASVLLCAAPPIGEFPGLPQPLRGVLGLRAGLLDNASQKVAQQMAGVYFVPVSANIASTPELFAADGIHPSARAYTLWGQALARFAADHLPQRRARR